jgi:hypothetical protein
MINKIVFAVVAALLTIPALAQFKPVTDGYEVALSDVRLPHADGGTIAFKPCGECNYDTRRVNKDVRWELNGKAVSLSKFRKRCEKIEDVDNNTVTITRHIESNRITKVAITVRDTEKGQDRG